MLGFQTILGAILAFFAWIWDIRPSYLQMMVFELGAGISLFFGWLFIKRGFLQEKSFPGLRFLLPARFRFIESFLLIAVILFFTLAVFVPTVPSSDVYSNEFLLFSIILFALSIDAIFLFVSQKNQLVDPFQIVAMIGKKSDKEISRLNRQQYGYTIDSLTEIAIQSIITLRLTLGLEAVRAMESFEITYLRSFREIRNKGEENEQLYFGLSYLLQNVELIHDKAIQAGLEPILSQLIISLGKLTIAASSLDSQMAQLPLHYLGRFVRNADTHGLSEILVKSTIILQEVASGILENPEIMNLKVASLFSSIIELLEEIAKITFRKDKSTDLALLMQPFQELKEKLTSEKWSSHPDSQVLINELTRVLGEFEALEVVLQTVPNIPGYTSKTQE